MWAKVHITETPIPLDPEPILGGNIIALPKRPYVEVATSKQLALAKKEKMALYVSHFVTCPDQDKWKRKTRSGDRRKGDNDG